MFSHRLLLLLLINSVCIIVFIARTREHDHMKTSSDIKHCPEVNFALCYYCNLFTLSEQRGVLLFSSSGIWGWARDRNICDSNCLAWHEEDSATPTGRPSLSLFLVTRETQELR